MKPSPWDQLTKGTTTFCDAHLCSWVDWAAIACAAVVLFTLLFHFGQKQLKS